MRQIMKLAQEIEGLIGAQTALHQSMLHTSLDALGLANGWRSGTGSFLRQGLRTVSPSFRYTRSARFTLPVQPSLRNRL